MTARAINPSRQSSAANDNEAPIAQVTNRRLLAEKAAGWKERTDTERETESSRVKSAKGEFLIRRAHAFAWSVPANDNQDWPLAKALRQSHDYELLGYAEYYRALADVALSDIVLGMAPTSALLERMRMESLLPEGDDGNQGVDYDRESTFDSGTGELVGTKIRQSKSADAVASDMGRQAKRAESGEEGHRSRGRSSAVRKPWRGDAPINSRIEARRELERLRAALGAIVNPFERLVVGGDTLGDVGVLSNSKDNAATGAGRAVAYWGLMALQSEIGPLDYQVMSSLPSSP